MAKTLFVGGLPWATTDEELREAFSKAGNVISATIIMERAPGRVKSKGYGFVEMSSDEDAERAIEMWNGKEFSGRTLSVKHRLGGDRPKGNGNDGYRNDRSGGERYSDRSGARSW